MNNNLRHCVFMNAPPGTSLIKFLWSLRLVIAR